jgi:hypothetical protein
MLDAGRFRQALVAVAVLQITALFTALRVGKQVRTSAVVAAEPARS